MFKGWLVCHSLRLLNKAAGLYLVLEQKLVPADEDLPQPFENLGPINHLLASQFAADEEEHL